MKHRTASKAINSDHRVSSHNAEQALAKTSIKSPAVPVIANEVEQVLLNLLLNAIDAMGEEGGALTVRTNRLIKPGAPVWAQVTIEDSGHGISQANLEHIFDPFFTTKHTSGEHAGTGLGLTIVHQIIHEHQGDIQVESTEGVGTTFFVNLPAIPMD